MKKILLLLLVFTAIHPSFAQLSKGGIPEAVRLRLPETGVPLTVYEHPPYAAAVADREAREYKDGRALPYLVAVGKDVDITFPLSGTFSTGDKGRKIWRTSIQVNDARAVGLYYDRFHLPEGVRLFLSNGNGMQLLGAYTAANNKTSGLFAHEPLQGGTVRLELDIDPSVNIRDIQLHCDKAAVYFRGVDYLARYTGAEEQAVLMDFFDSVFAGSSSRCMIDAQCPQGQRYFNQNRSTLSIVIPDENREHFAWCTASMVNATGNTTTGCRNYLLTAAHCDQDNSGAKQRFDQMLLRFNYQQPQCGATTIPEANTLVGATFVARSLIDTVNYVIKGDFLLLQPQDEIPASWNVTLAGWNRDTAIARNETEPRKFISFHHPQGDVRKLSAGHQIVPDHFTTSVTEMTHWLATLEDGYILPGSSGASLFDGAGEIIGTLTGSRSTPFSSQSCNVLSNGDTLDMVYLYKTGLYSRISYNWQGVDGPEHELRPWLDPVNSGLLRLEGLKSSCQDMDSVNTVTVRQPYLEEALEVFPNPAAGGQFNIRFNLPEPSDIRVDMVDLNGRRVAAWKLAAVRSGVYRFSSDHIPAGMYLLRIGDGQGYTGRKIMIRP